MIVYLWIVAAKKPGVASPDSAMSGGEEK